MTDTKYGAPAHSDGRSGPLLAIKRNALIVSLLAVAAALTFHAAAIRHETTHLVGPFMAITDRLTGRVETCRVTLDGATCKNVEHLETLEERANRLAREGDSSEKRP